MKIKLYFILFIFSSKLLYGQDQDDFPSSLNFYTENNDNISVQICSDKEVKHRQVVSETFGREFYCSGNLHAEGPIKKISSETILYPNQDNLEVLTTEYIRDGLWKVYFDSTSQILKSEGKFIDGELDGKWIIYAIDGKTSYEIDFWNGQIKTKVEIGQNGNKNKLIERSYANIIVMNYEVLLILLALLPIVLLRIVWNMLIYNKIHNTEYIPLLQDWQKGGKAMNIYCTFIFWWMIKATDNPVIRKYKLIGNWISILSIILFVSIMLILGIYGGNE